MNNIKQLDFQNHYYDAFIHNQLYESQNYHNHWKTNTLDPNISATAMPNKLSKFSHHESVSKDGCAVSIFSAYITI